MILDQNTSREITTTFRFLVAIDGKTVGAFMECTLPTVEWQVEEVKEGGVNTSIHQLPGQRRRTTITLKNGVGLAEEMMNWYLMAMNEQFERRMVTISLLGPSFEKFMEWHIEKAFPVKWSGPQLKTDTNTIAIQSLELACGEVMIS